MQSYKLWRQLPRLLVALCFMQASYSYAQSNANGLYRIKKIYIESYPNVKEETKFEPFFKAQLEKRGFKIVNDASEEDAILSGDIQAEIVLHGDGSIPDKSIYRFQLTLPNKEVVWNGRIKFVSKSSIEEDHAYAARKIAEKIAKKVGAK